MKFLTKLWRSWFPIPHEWDLENAAIIKPEITEIDLASGKRKVVRHRIILTLQCKKCGACASLYKGGDLLSTSPSCVEEPKETAPLYMFAP